MMQKTEFIWYDGKFVPWEEAKVHVLCHTLHYGAGAFEGIRFYKTAKGPAIFRLDEHVERLFYSANALKMPWSFTEDDIKNAIIETVRINKLEEGYIRPLVFYGYGKLGVNPVGAPVNCIIACWPWKSYLGHDHVDIKTSRFIRIHPDSSIVDAKLVGHYVNGILASMEIKGTHYHEALLLDSHGYIAEGVGENFFMVKAGKLYTPKLGTILAGITRDTILEVANKFGIDVEQVNIPIKDAYDADEAFFTGTAAEVTPIRSIDDKLIGKDQIGAVTKQIKDAYADVVRGKNAEFAQYLTIVPQLDPVVNG